MKQEEVKTISRVNFSGKWAEFWFEENEKSESFHNSSKAYRLWEAVEKAELNDHICNNGFKGCKLKLFHDGFNWEISEIMMPELTTPTQPNLSAEEFIREKIRAKNSFPENYQMEGLHCYNVNGEECLRWAHEFKELFNQPAQFTPPRPPQEEADRLVDSFEDIDFEDAVLRSIKIVSYNRDSLKLLGLSTAYEEEVLTILKGM